MIRPWTPGDTDAVQGLLLADGRGERVRDSVRLKRTISSSTRAVVAEEDGQVVGFGRCVTDDASNGYLSLLVVDPAHRRRGIGSSIVSALMGSNPEITWVLRAGTPGSAPFWESLGFVRSEITYERVRDR